MKSTAELLAGDAVLLHRLQHRLGEFGHLLGRGRAGRALDPGERVADVLLRDPRRVALDLEAEIALLEQDRRAVAAQHGVAQTRLEPVPARRQRAGEVAHVLVVHAQHGAEPVLLHHLAGPLGAVCAQPVPVDPLLPIQPGDAEIRSHVALPPCLRAAHLCPKIPDGARWVREVAARFPQRFEVARRHIRIGPEGDHDGQNHTSRACARRRGGPRRRAGHAGAGAERQAPVAHDHVVAEAPAWAGHVGGARRRAHRHAVGRAPRSHGVRGRRGGAGLRGAGCGRLGRRRDGSHRRVLLAGQGAGRGLLHHRAVRAHSERARLLDRRRRRPGAVGRALRAVRRQAVHGRQYRECAWAAGSAASSRAATTCTA